MYLELSFLLQLGEQDFPGVEVEVEVTAGPITVPGPITDQVVGGVGVGVASVQTH